MAGSKDSWTASKVQALLDKKWPGKFYFKGSTPYDKGGIIYFIDGEHPEEIAEFPKNADAGIAISEENYYPGGIVFKTATLFDGDKKFKKGDKKAEAQARLHRQKLFYERAIGYKMASDEHMLLAKIKPTDPDGLSTLRFILKKIMTKLRISSRKKE